MVTISLCMIVRDEEDVLGRCLDSIKDAVEEIIIVDTGSVDSTKEIARTYTDKVFDFEWVDDFSAARNYAYAQATQMYQMWLDADDVVSPEAREKLLELKQTLSPDVDVVTMKYNTHFDQKGNVTWTSCRERLTKREKQYQWKDPVHECIPLTGNIFHSDIAIDHRKIKQERTSMRNLRIYERLESSGEPMTPRQQYYFARELRDHRQYQKALYYFELFLEDGKGWSEDNISACYAISQCYRNLKRPDRALNALLRAFTYGGPRAEIVCEIGYHYKNLKQYQAAAEWFTVATHLTRPAFAVFWINAYWGYIPHIELSVCHHNLGNLEKAIYHNVQAGLFRPGDTAVENNARFYEGLRKDREQTHETACSSAEAHDTL